MMYIKDVIPYIIIGFISISIIAIRERKNDINFSYKKNHDYYREIPFKRDLDIIYYTGKQIKLIKNFTFIPAFLAKMIKDHKIEYQKIDNKVFLKFDNYTSYDDNESINDFFNLISPLIKNETIRLDEISIYIEKNLERIKELNYKICNRAKKKLCEKNLLVYNRKKYHTTAELRTKLSELNGFTNFIKDFSILKERKIYEAKIWDNYMVLAVLLGIKDAYDEDLKLLYLGMKIEKFYEIVDDI